MNITFSNNTKMTDNLKEKDQSTIEIEIQGRAIYADEIDVEAESEESIEVEETRNDRGLVYCGEEDAVDGARVVHARHAAQCITR